MAWDCVRAHRASAPRLPKPMFLQRITQEKCRNWPTARSCSAEWCSTLSCDCWRSWCYLCNTSQHCLSQRLHPLLSCTPPPVLQALSPASIFELIDGTVGAASTRALPESSSALQQGFNTRHPAAEPNSHYVERSRNSLVLLQTLLSYITLDRLTDMSGTGRRCDWGKPATRIATWLCSRFPH